MATSHAAPRDPISGRLATAVTLAVGTPLLRAAIRAPRGGSAFRRRTAALAATWVSGGAATGQFTRDRWQVRDTAEARDKVLRPAATAAGAVAVFSLGAVVVSKVPFLRREIETVIAHATRGSFAQATALALVTGASEEVFFRGSLHDLADDLDLPTLPATAGAYTLVTCATGNPLLVLAAGILAVLTGHERRRTDSLLAPTVVHLGWSIGMITVLPRVTARQRQRSADPATDA